MMKQINLIFILIAITFVSCSAQSQINLKELTKKKSDELKLNKSVKCEQVIEGTMKYNNINEIEKRNLNKLKKQAEKCNCNTIYLDFENYLGAADELDFLFYAVCVKE